MNLSSIVTRIKLKLGLINLATPFPNMDETIQTIIQEITLPVFSLYFEKPRISLLSGILRVIMSAADITNKCSK